MDKTLFTQHHHHAHQEPKAASDDVDFNNIPGVDPDAGVEGGVDPSKEDDNCAGGACKI